MNTGLSLGLVSGGIWFALFSLAHITLLHVLDLRDRFKVTSRLFVTAAAGHLFTSTILFEPLSTVWGRVEGVLALAMGWLAMICLFVLYMPCLFVIATSLSVQTLVLVARTREGQVPMAQLRTRFASVHLTAGRLETMAVNGYLIRDAEGYRPTTKGVLVARAFRVIKRLWRLGAGG